MDNVTEAEALWNGIAACDRWIKTACDPDDHGEENVLARAALPIVNEIRLALTHGETD